MKRLVSVLAATAFALMMQSASCLPMAGANEQSMKCCASMSCAPANQSHGCCKNMASGKAPTIIPTHSLSLQAPSLRIFEYPPIAKLLHRSLELPPVIGAQQHSPPELYTLHASLLI